MKLPRPLLIVLVVILVLAVVACVAAAAGAGEQDDTDSERKTVLRGENPVVNLFKGLDPGSAPITITASDTTCTLDSGNLVVSGSCSVEIDGSDAPRRKLLLRPQSGTMLMAVDVTHEGETNGDTLSVSSTEDEGSVVLTAGDSAQISLFCTCTVLVNP